MRPVEIGEEAEGGLEVLGAGGQARVPRTQQTKGRLGGEGNKIEHAR